VAELLVGFRGMNTDGVPRLGLYLKSDAPLRMLLKLIDQKLGVPIQGVMPVDSTVVAVGEIGLLGVSGNDNANDNANGNNSANADAARRDATKKRLVADVIIAVDF